MYDDETRQKAFLVCGPPSSGKTTFVRDRMRDGDLVLDVDALFSAISFQSLHCRTNEKKLLRYALECRDAIIETAVLDGSNRPQFWFILGGADPIQRKRYQELFNAEVHVLAIAREVCIRRAENDPNRRKQIDRIKEVIAQWWHEFEPRHEFETIYGE